MRSTPAASPAPWSPDATGPPHHPRPRRRPRRGGRRGGRPRHHRRRCRPRCRHPRPDGARGRRARPGVRHVALVVQARARRPALPRAGTARHRPRERRRARHPHGGHSAHTTTRTLPRPRRLNATETLGLAPALRADTLRGGLLAWDGQLEDDARLVVTVARTAASYGAHVRTRARVIAATGAGGTVRDELTGTTYDVRARAVVNATGVGAGGLDEQVRLRPSRGTHVVLRGSALPHTRVAVMVPIPDTTSRFAMVLPQPDGTIYVGLTDEPVTGPVPDVPEPSEAEVDFLLGAVASAFTTPPTREDVVGAFAGLRPLLEVSGTDATSDLSRRHAILTSATGVTTVVGGKLTTYRRMAQDTLDALVAAGRLDAGPCRTASLPLLGAAAPDDLRRTSAPARLVRRFGTDAGLVLATAREVTGLADDELLVPVSEVVPVTLAELVFGVTHEGAHDVADLLDRRTRVGLVTTDRASAEPLARRALELAGRAA